VICIELKKARPRIHRKTIKAELMELAARHEITREIKILLFRDSFPVDIRHNAKIFREQLAVWAARQVKPAAIRGHHRAEEGR
jgi:hypothetical protein